MASLASLLAPASLLPTFEALDDFLQAPGCHGTVVVTTADAAGALAVARHVTRRAQAEGRPVVRASFRSDSAARDIARRVGVGVPDDVVGLSDALAKAIDLDGCVVVIPNVAGSWDREVWRSVSERVERALLVFVSTEPLHFELHAPVAFQVDTHADAGARARFFDALSRTYSKTHAKLSQLDDLACRTERPPRPPSALSSAAQALWTKLTLAMRPWPASRIDVLGSADALQELLDADRVELRDGLVDYLGEAPSNTAVDDELAAALVAVLADDPWACCRAAELCSELQQSEGHMRRALALASDVGCRSELWSRWRTLLQRPHTAPETLLRVAELALELGDVDVALDFARPAAAAADEFKASLVLGRAFLGRGDLVSAHASLTRAERLAPDADARAVTRVELAETAYARGDYDSAAQLAASVEGQRVQRLAARNVLGKLLLARGQWDAADAHFADDVCEAIALGASTAELRARVNRAIALLSRGSRQEAEALLDSVLREGEVRAEPRAVAFALSNLAVLAIERHENARALELLERTTTVHRRLGDRLNFSRDIANLVELRVRLGLWEHAEQGLRFGRQALGPGAPPRHLTELGLAAARVHLAQGRTLEADRELRAAMKAAAQALDDNKLGECHRLAARLALEDGSVKRALAETSRARELANADYDHAETALLEAMCRRASGGECAELAAEAVRLTLALGDDEFAREARVLAAEVALAEGDQEAAEAHIQSACQIRDEVAAGLPGVIRDAYLARPDLVRLARLARLASDGDAPPVSREEPAPSRRRGERRGELRYVGRDAAVRSLLDAAERVAPSDATVLVLGESGTGKELVAELVHRASRRGAGPLVKVNCAALVESLLLSELFGHEKGSFTGATGRRRGRFERANGGTLFLDEIGDISPRTQVALLRVLEEHTIERVGGTSAIAVDVRIVCATHRNLTQMVERGEFREDLYYRLAGITLEVPALRERLSDLPLLCRALLERIASERGETPKTLAPDALELMTRYRWPGNVRELENTLRAASLFAAEDSIQVVDLVEHVEALRRVAAEPVGPAPESRRLSSLPPSASVAPGLGHPDADPVTGVAYREIREGGVTLSDLKRNIERECIARALGETSGNITRAATLLGMKRPRLSQLVKQYGLTSSSEEAS